MHIDQPAERPVTMTHTEHQGADTPHRSCPGGQCASNSGSTSQPEAGSQLASTASVAGASPLQVER